MFEPVEFSSAVVGRREDGDLVLALMDGLEVPLSHVRACVALLQCSEDAGRRLLLLLEEQLDRKAP